MLTGDFLTIRGKLIQWAHNIHFLCSFVRVYLLTMQTVFHSRQLLFTQFTLLSCIDSLLFVKFVEVRCFCRYLFL